MSDENNPAPQPDETAMYRHAPEGPGAKIGPFKLLQVIGEGGFGVVYMAEQEQPVRRKVALKIIKPGMDTKEVIARFESERQALALMDHPNIARVLDAGTTAGGRPYFVMELVRGVPITEYCDKNNLNTADRLELFCTVCRAVQHAHQKGVIHRDIKPSNVLVTLHDGQPVPKVIDFGVAKATTQRLTERTMFTAYGQMIGTPAYMSPEQAEMSGLDIDTRSDIYSLGVLLYELLTGTTPLEMKRLKEATYVEMQRLIREEDPPKPSTRISTLGENQTIIASHRRTDPVRLRQTLKGDLDLIVMKALEKERGRRYETPNSFAQDIQRYLQQEPIQARPPSALYRLQKFTSRNKAAVVTAAAVVLCLAVGTVISTVFAIVALDQRNSARANLIVAETERAAADAARRDAEHQRNLALQAEQNEKSLRQLADQRRIEAENARQAAAESARQADEKRRDVERQKSEIDKLNTQLVDSLDSQRRTLYASQMVAAQKAWEIDNIPYLLEMLDAHRPKPGETDLRGFEWFYWNRRCNSDLRTWKLPGGMSLEGGLGIAFSIFGRSMEFSPDGTRLTAFFGTPAPTQPGQRIRIWDVEKRIELPDVTVLPALALVAGQPAVAGGAAGLQNVAPGAWGRSILQLDERHVAVLTPLRSAAQSTAPPISQSLAANTQPTHTELTLYDLDSRKALYSIREPTASGFVLARSAAQFAALFDEPANEADQSGQAGSRVQSARLFSALTGEAAGSIPLTGGPWGALAISPDGSRIAATTFAFALATTSPAQLRNLSVRVWDVASKTEKATFPHLAAYALEFTPDAKRLLVIGAQQPEQPSAGIGLRVNTAAYDVETGTLLWSHPMLNVGTAAMAKPVVSRDGQWVAFCRPSVLAHERSLKLFNVGTGAPAPPLKGHTDPIIHAGFAADGRRVHTVAADGSIKTWEIPPPADTGPANMLPNIGTVQVLSPDGSRQASVPTRTTGKGELSLQNAATKATLWKETLPAIVEQFTFSPDGQYVAASWMGSTSDPSQPGQIRVWDAATGNQLRTFSKFAPSKNTRVAKAENIVAGPDLAFSPSSRELVITTGDPAAQPPQFRLQRLEIATGREIMISEPIVGRPVDLLRVGSASRILCEVAPPPPSAAAKTKASPAPPAPETVLKAVDAATGRVVWSRASVPRLLTSTFDGARLCGAVGREIAVVDTETGQPITSITLEPGSFPTKLAISRNGQRIVVVRPVGIVGAMQQPTVVLVFDAETGAEAFKLQGHTDPVVDVAFSPDGKRIATTAGSAADTVLWDAETGQNLLTLPGADASLAFSADGRQLRGEFSHNPFGEYSPVATAIRRVVIADAASLHPASEAQRLLAVLARSSGQTLLTRSELVKTIDTDPSLSAEVRAKALEMLKELKRDAGTLNNAAAAMAKLPDQPPATYQRALEFADEAVELQPKNANIRNTRGIVHFRCGAFQQAREDLLKSMELTSEARQPLIPANIGFLAMVEYQLANKAEATKQLDRFREIVRRSGSARRDDWRLHLVEAEELFGIQPVRAIVHAEIPGWGQPIDPASDCEFVASAESLAIKVPGTFHSLAPANNNFDAPRVLRQLAGDFTLQAKVAFPIELKKPLTDRGFTFFGAGLLVWEDAGNLLRVERNGYFQHANFTAGVAIPSTFKPTSPLASHAPLVEHIQNGRDISSPGNFWDAKTPALPGEATWLRIVRRGPTFQIALSHDGLSWQDAPQVETKFPAKVQVGLVARNNSASPFQATFSEFKLTQP